jgi:hypothetical protein
MQNNEEMQIIDGFFENITESETVKDKSVEQAPEQNRFGCTEGSEEETSDMSACFDGLVDLVLNDQGKLVFLVKERGSLTMKAEHEVDGKLFIPPPHDKVIWKVPRGSEVIRHWTQDTDPALFDDLVQYHSTISELPSQNHYRFLAAWVMHTYLLEKFEYSPIPWFHGIAERGKTRTGKGLIYASFRGVHLITLREAHLLRLAQDLKATLFIDVMDLWKKAEAAGSEDILLCRYEKGAKVPRVLYPGKGKFRDTVYFNIYGATLVATNEPVNEIFASRTTPVIMPESARQFEDDIKPEHGLPFRERLLAFRARWMDRDLPAVPKPCAGRLGDILRPLRQIVNVVCHDEDWFMEFVKGLEVQRKHVGADSLDAQVVAAMVQEQKSISNGHLLNEVLLNALNEKRSEREKITSQKLGRIIVRLGFEKYSSGQQRGFYWKDDLVALLCQRYGLTFCKEKASQEP